MKKQVGGLTDQQKDSAMKIGKYIVMGIMILLVLYLAYYLYTSYQNKKNNEPIFISDPMKATKAMTIQSEQVPISINGNEYGYSFWMFIDDWNYKFDHPKCVLYRGTFDCDHANPSIWLYPRENKLMVRCETYSNTSNSGMYANNTKTLNPRKDPSLLGVNKSCDIDNIPLQTWVHVCVSLWNRTLDVYINGKLTRSCILDGVAKLNNGNLYVTQYGGYSGYISKLQFYNYALTPEKIYNIYKKGPYPGVWWWNNFTNTLPKVNASVTVTSGDGDNTNTYSI